MFGSEVVEADIEDDQMKEETVSKVSFI